MTLLPRIVSELDLAVSTLRAALAVHEPSIPATALTELEAVAKAQSDWVAELKTAVAGSAGQPPASPSSASLLSSVSAGSTPACSPAAARTPSSSVTAASAPPGDEASPEFAVWKARMLMRMRRYLTRRLDGERAKLAAAVDAVEAAEFASRMIESDLAKVDLALHDLRPDIVPSPVELGLFKIGTFI